MGTLRRDEVGRGGSSRGRRWGLNVMDSGPFFLTKTAAALTG